MPKPKTFTETLVVCRDRGILGTYGSRRSYGNTFNPKKHIMVDVEVTIPTEMWNPMKLKIEVPADYRQDLVNGTAEKIQIPVEVAKALVGKSDMFTVQDVTKNGADGLFAVLVRKSNILLNKIRTKDELAAIENKRKVGKLQIVQEEIAKLEKLKAEIIALKEA
jgi:hypothetical protein